MGLQHRLGGTYQEASVAPAPSPTCTKASKGHPTGDEGWSHHQGPHLGGLLKLCILTVPRFSYLGMADC